MEALVKCLVSAQMTQHLFLIPIFGWTWLRFFVTSAELTSDPSPLHECVSLRIQVTVCFEQGGVVVVVFLL